MVNSPNSGSVSARETSLLVGSTKSEEIILLMTVSMMGIDSAHFLPTHLLVHLD
jgi:hypothetical protein